MGDISEEAIDSNPLTVTVGFGVIIVSFDSVDLVHSDDCYCCPP